MELKMYLEDTRMQQQAVVDPQPKKQDKKHQYMYYIVYKQTYGRHKWETIITNVLFSSFLDIFPFETGTHLKRLRPHFRHIIMTMIYYEVY